MAPTKNTKRRQSAGPKGTVIGKSKTLAAKTKKSGQKVKASPGMRLKKLLLQMQHYLQNSSNGTKKIRKLSKKPNNKPQSQRKRSKLANIKNKNLGKCCRRAPNRRGSGIDTLLAKNRQ